MEPGYYNNGKHDQCRPVPVETCAAKCKGPYSLRYRPAIESGMLRFLLICLSFSGVEALHAQTLKVENLQCEYLHDPLGIESQQPSLKWELVSVSQNVLQ